MDASRNDLPWQFTALSVPSVLFFPAGGEEETRAFPSTKALSVRNLLSFLVANLPRRDRTRLSVALCDDDCIVSSRVEISKKVSASGGEQINLNLF